MEAYRIYVISIAVILPTFLTVTVADDFATAREKINKAKPNISYSTFCVERKAGEDKIACRIKDVPSVGFLVCKTPVLEEVNCNVVISTEVSNIQKVSTGNVKTVEISPPPIDSVKCGEDASLNCSGFLEKWVAPDVGRFKQVRDHIDNKTVPQLISDVKNFTSKPGLSTTAADLTKIKNYMMLDPAQKKYRQICDLQGFFLVNGGFLVNDVPAIETTTIDGNCWDGEPTTQQVLDALNQMIKAFSSSFQSTSGGINHSGHNVNTMILLTGFHMFFIIIVGRI